MEPAQTWWIWAGQQCTPSSCTKRVHEKGDLAPQMNWQDEGHGKSLRRTRGEAVGEKLGTAPVNRHTLNMGTISAPPLCHSARVGMERPAVD
jgi:hypothetical protein